MNLKSILEIHLLDVHVHVQLYAVPAICESLYFKMKFFSARQLHMDLISFYHGHYYFA